MTSARTPAALLETVDVRDVGMVQRRQRLRFALEPREAIRVGRERLGQDFDGNVPIELRVARAVDLAHAAGANGGEDFIGAEPGAGGEGQR